MKLIGHIVGKDFRRLKWGFVAWWAVIAGKLGLGFFLISGLPLRHHYFSEVDLQTLLRGVMTVEGLFAFVLTGLLVQEDSLVGTTPFWITRPISGARLLAAKFTGWVMLFWISPIVLTLPWWLVGGFGPHQITLAAFEILALQAVVSLPAALVATLTDTLGRFLVWSFVLAFALVAAPAGLGLINAFANDQTKIILLATAGGAIMIVAFVFATVRQFLRRDRPRSLAWLGAGAVLVPCLVFLIAPRFGSLPDRLQSVVAILGWVQWSDWQPERAQGVTLTLDSFRAASPQKDHPLDEVEFSTYFAASGVPENLILSGGEQARQRWTWPGGPTLTRDGVLGDVGGWWGVQYASRHALGIVDAKPDEETQRYREKERAERIAAFIKSKVARGEDGTGVEAFLRRAWAPPIAGTSGVTLYTTVLPSMAERMNRTPPAYEATVPLILVRPEPWIEVPWNSTAWQAHAGHGFRLAPEPEGFALIDSDHVRVTQGDGTVVAVARNEQIMQRPIVATMPEFLWDRIFVEAHWMRMRRLEPVFYVVNRAGGDVQGQNVYHTPKVTIASVGIVREIVRPFLPTVRRGEKWIPRDPHWRDGLTFALVGFRDEAQFTREVKVERFEARP